jgi:hypothetical protein
MKVSKIISLILLITLICLFYVWQKTEIVKLAYQKQKKLALYAELLDQNMILRYNLNTLVSFNNLERTLKLFDTDYEIPHLSHIIDLRDKHIGRVVEIASSGEKYPSSKRRKISNIFLNLFIPRSQAEAQDKSN